MTSKKFDYDDYLQAVGGVAGMSRQEFESFDADIIQKPIEKVQKVKVGRKIAPKTDFSQMSADEITEHKLRVKRESAERYREKKRNERKTH